MKQEDSSPPPAYAEQEFDQKVSTALQVSLSVPQPPLGGEEEEEWEEWDDAAFNAAAQAVSSLGSHGVDLHSSRGLGLASSSSSSTRPQESHLPERKGGDIQSHNLSAIKPLCIHKKTPSPRPKPRPSWLSETQVDAQSSASGSIRHEIPPDDDEDHSIPPPPFTEVAPSPDGRPIIVLSYQPPGDSRPPSPLNSPMQMPLQIPATYGRDSAPLSRPSSRTQPDQPQTYTEHFHANSQATSWSHRPTRQSLPGIRPLPNPHAQQRPSTMIMSSSKHPQAPRMNFNPYVAYGQSGEIFEPSPTQYSGRQFNPSELYKYEPPNLAVVYLLRSS